MSKDLVVVKVNDIEIEVQPDSQHDWLLSTKDVAEGYGLSESGVRSVKERYADELEEGKHWVLSQSETKVGRPATMWTKRGVVRLGFFIKTPMAKEFRDWAEDYISSKTSSDTSTLPIRLVSSHFIFASHRANPTPSLDSQNSTKTPVRPLFFSFKGFSGSQTYLAPM